MIQKPQGSWKQRLVLPLLGFGVVCLVTSFALGFVASKVVLTDQVPAIGGIVGPFAIAKNGTVLTVDVSQSLPLRAWSFVSVALLDARKQWLIGFGDEFWHESGNDDGYWEEADTHYEATLTIPEDGRYYLQVKPENNMPPNAATGNVITVRATTRRFSTVPHFAVGMVAVILGLILSFVSGGHVFRALKES